MNRRQFCLTTASFLSASQASAHIVNPEPAPLSADEQKIVAMLQGNMIAYQQYCLAEPVIRGEWVEQLPDQFRRLLLRRVAGIQPMAGPTSLVWTRRLKPRKPHPFQNLALETLVDWRAMGMRWDQRSIIPPWPVEKLAACSRSQPIADPGQLAESLDAALIKTFAHRAHIGSWDVLQTVGDGVYVLVHPDSVHRVSRYCNPVPIIPSGVIALSTAIIGYKRCEFDASFYFLPYITTQMASGPDGTTLPGKYVSRYSFTAPVDYDPLKKPQWSADLPQLWSINL